MFSRAWIAAIAFGLIICSSGWYAWREIQIYHLKHAEQRDNVTSYDASTSEQFLRNCVEAGDGGFFTILNCVVQSPDANRESQRSKYDLEAQQEMAEWAFLVAVISGFMLFVTSVGVFYVALTLGEARATTKAAIDSAKYQRVAGRPLLTPNNYHLERQMDGSGVRPVDPPTYAFYMKIHNVGGSPAFIRKYGITHFIGNGDPDEKTTLKEEELSGRWFVRADAMRDFGAPFFFIEMADDAERELVEELMRDLLVFGYLEYADSFGVIWQSGFCFEFIPSAKPDENMAVSGPSRLWYDREIGTDSIA